MPCSIHYSTTIFRLICVFIRGNSAPFNMPSKMWILTFRSTIQSALERGGANLDEGVPSQIKTQTLGTLTADPHDQRSPFRGRDRPPSLVYRVREAGWTTIEEWPATARRTPTSRTPRTRRRNPATAWAQQWVSEIAGEAVNYCLYICKIWIFYIPLYILNAK